VTGAVFTSALDPDDATQYFHNHRGPGPDGVETSFEPRVPEKLEADIRRIDNARKNSVAGKSAPTTTTTLPPDSTTMSQATPATLPARVGAAASVP
jgi:hypothetical protein